jgi:hypothetical protein
MRLLPSWSHKTTASFQVSCHLSKSRDCTDILNVLARIAAEQGLLEQAPEIEAMFEAQNSFVQPPAEQNSTRRASGRLPSLDKTQYLFLGAHFLQCRSSQNLAVS